MSLGDLVLGGSCLGGGGGRCQNILFLVLELFAIIFSYILFAFRRKGFALFRFCLFYGKKGESTKKELQTTLKLRINDFGNTLKVS